MIIAVVKATFAVAKRKPEKNSGLYGIRTLDLCMRYRCSALPIILIFFSGFLFETAKVAYIIAMIILHLIPHSAVHIYHFHTFIISSSFHRYWIFTIVLYKLLCIGQMIFHSSLVLSLKGWVTDVQGEIHRLGWCISCGLHAECWLCCKGLKTTGCYGNLT